MKKIVLVAAAALAVLGPVGASSADSHASTQVIHGHLVESSDWGWRTGYVSLDNDFTAKHHQIASDVTTCHGTGPKATRAVCQAALAFKGGLVVIRFVESRRPGPIQGRVVSGTGRYHGATGVVTIREGQNDSGASTAIWTLHLHR